MKCFFSNSCAGTVTSDNEACKSVDGEDPVDADADADNDVSDNDDDDDDDEVVPGTAVPGTADPVGTVDTAAANDVS
jgi:hypothetical protein